MLASHCLNSGKAGCFLGVRGQYKLLPRMASAPRTYMGSPLFAISAELVKQESYHWPIWRSLGSGVEQKLHSLGMSLYESLRQQGLGEGLSSHKTLECCCQADWTALSSVGQRGGH